MRFTSAIVFGVFTVVAQLPSPPPPPPPPSVQGGQPRDLVRRPEPTGTGVIRGRVVAADTGSPVRRANVNLMPAQPLLPPPPSSGTPPGTTTTVTTTMTMMNGVSVQIGNVNAIRPRTATTDSQGVRVHRLPAGTYRLMATAGQYSAAYLGIAYGAKKPTGPGSFDSGQPIELTNGQTFDKAVIGLPRGAVITGRVTDESGEALARVQVYTVFYPPGSTRGQRWQRRPDRRPRPVSPYGLTPGEYSVVAEARGRRSCRQTLLRNRGGQDRLRDDLLSRAPDEAAAQPSARAGAGRRASKSEWPADGCSDLGHDPTPGTEANRTSGTLFRARACELQLWFLDGRPGSLPVRTSPGPTG